MKANKRKSLKIIAATTMTVFSLFVAITGAFAWFVSKLNESSTGDSFEISTVETAVQEISIHEFYGTSTGSNPCYGFNPVPVGCVDYSNPQSPTTIGTLSIELEKYSLEYPNHPVLILFKVSGTAQTIEAETSYPFLSQDKPGADTLDGAHTVSTYSALPASANDNEIFEVTNDEHQNGEFTDNGTRKKITTRYKYVAAESKYELIWVDLAMFKNPMSSVMQAHSFEFDFTRPFNRNGNNLTINSSSTALLTKTYTHVVNDVVQTDTSSGIWIPVAQFKDADAANSNMSSFVTINHGEATYSPETVFYEGSVSGDTYIGIAVDYYSDALIYLFSEFLGHDYLNEDITFKCDWITKV